MKAESIQYPPFIIDVAGEGNIIDAYGKVYPPPRRRKEKLTVSPSWTGASRS
jgi:hypothetical protein